METINFQNGITRLNETTMNTFQDNIVKALTKDEIGARIKLDLDPETYIMTLKLMNKFGNVLDQQTVDLPMEMMVLRAEYDKTTNEIVLTMQNGDVIRLSVGELILGLVTDERLDKEVEALEKKINDIIITPRTKWW